MSKATLVAINEQVYVTKYDNGYMVETSGKSEDGEWVTNKSIFGTAEEAYAYALEKHSGLPLNE